MEVSHNVIDPSLERLQVRFRREHRVGQSIPYLIKVQCKRMQRPQFLRGLPISAVGLWRVLHLRVRVQVRALCLKLSTVWVWVLFSSWVRVRVLRSILRVLYEYFSNFHKTSITFFIYDCILYFISTHNVLVKYSASTSTLALSTSTSPSTFISKSASTSTEKVVLAEYEYWVRVSQPWSVNIILSVKQR